MCFFFPSAAKISPSPTHLYANQNLGIRDARKKKRIQKKPRRCTIAIPLFNSLSFNKIHTATTSTSVPLSTAAQPVPPSQLCFTQVGRKPAGRGCPTSLGWHRCLLWHQILNWATPRAMTSWSQTAWEHLLCCLFLALSFPTLPYR